MTKLRWMLPLVFCGLVCCCGCFSYAEGPLLTPIGGSIRWAGEIGDPSAGMSKRGSASCIGVLGISFGNASLKEAMEDGGITKVHHYDVDNVNVLGIYASHTTIAYGSRGDGLGGWPGPEPRPSANLRCEGER